MRNDRQLRRYGDTTQGIEYGPSNQVLDECPTIKEYLKTASVEEVVRQHGPVTEKEISDLLERLRSQGVEIEDVDDTREYLYGNGEVTHVLPDIAEEAWRSLPDDGQLLLRVDHSEGAGSGLLLLIIRLRKYDHRMREVRQSLMRTVWQRLGHGVPFTVTSDFIPAA